MLCERKANKHVVCNIKTWAINWLYRDSIISLHIYFINIYRGIFSRQKSVINAMGNIKVRNIETLSSKESILGKRTRFEGMWTSVLPLLCMSNHSDTELVVKTNKHKNHERETCLESCSSGLINSRISWRKARGEIN